MVLRVCGKDFDVCMSAYMSVTILAIEKKQKQE